MSKKLSVGDKVVFQFYNTPDKKFYGAAVNGTIIAIDPDHVTGLGHITPYQVKVDNKNYYESYWLERKEIIRRVE